MFWQENFVYEIAHLTQSEAGRLKSASSVDAIRNKLTEARNASIEQLDASRDQAQTEKSCKGVNADIAASDGLLVAVETENETAGAT